MMLADNNRPEPTLLFGLSQYALQCLICDVIRADASFSTLPLVLVGCRLNLRPKPNSDEGEALICDKPYRLGVAEVPTTAANGL